MLPEEQICGCGVVPCDIHVNYIPISLGLNDYGQELKPDPSLGSDYFNIPKRYVIELDEYEIANLRAALYATGCGAWHLSMKDPPIQSNPLEVLNNGDWVSQIQNKLPKVNVSPNYTSDELAESARKWREHNNET